MTRIRVLEYVNVPRDVLERALAEAARLCDRTLGADDCRAALDDLAEHVDEDRLAR